MTGPGRSPLPPSPPGPEPNPPGTGPGTRPGTRIPRWLSLAILTGLLVWNAYLIFAPTSTPSVDVPYSTFLAQAKADNVAQVTFTDQAVTGTFRTAVQYPPPNEARADVSPVV